MSYLEVGGRRYPVEVGEMVIGSDPQGAIVLTGATVAPRHAFLRATADGQVSIHKADEHLEVLVNGVRLGAQPTPLLHGDKVVVGGQELRFGDERGTGSTQFLHVGDSALTASEGLPVVKGSTRAAGGRLVSLTDGREYTISSAPLVIGRSTDCDVVLTNRNVSRRHAEIIESPKGYLIVDSSTNGCFVNDKRVPGQRRLERGDVIRVGDDEFRFYAEELEEAEPAESSAAEPEAEEPLESEEPFLPDPAKARGEGRAAGMGPPPPPSPPPGAHEQLRDTLFGIPGVQLPGVTRGAPPEVEPPRRPPPVERGPPAAAAEQRAPPPSKAKVLAKLVVRSGEMKGERFAIKVPIANIGRAEYNDVIIADPSVSTSHAKLQRREGIWILVDLGSTNGTQVDGDPVHGEAPLAPGAHIRFGHVDVLFEPTDDAAVVEAGGGTQLIDALPVEEPHPVPVPPSEPEEARPPPAMKEVTPEWSVVATPTDLKQEPARSESHLFSRLVWGLFVLVVLAVLIIVFAG